MLALVLGESAVVTHDRPAPERRPGEALVRVRLSGVCDTDLQLARGYMGFAGVPGHEFVGEVVASDDPRWHGQRVVADINAGRRRAHRAPPRDRAVFAEPLAAALHVLDEFEGRPRPKRAVVLGDGKLGLLIVRGSRCGEMNRAVAVLASGAVDPLPLVEARYPLARADEALAHAGRRGALKILIDAPA